jgi:quercetin 2,3-dioxygenase
MGSSSVGPPTLRWVPGEVVAKSTTARLLLPGPGLSTWLPFTRAVETIATAARQLPAHGHEGEEVMTYMIEGFASYQYGNAAPVPLPPGSVRLLTAPSRATHRVSPAQGSAIRWFSLVLSLPSSLKGEPRVQSAQPRSTETQPDGTVVRKLVGPGGSVFGKSGLSADEISFVQMGTTFQRVGRDRRGLVYALSGRGTIDSQAIEGGEGVLIEGASGIAVHGQSGLRVLVASAPTPA